MRQLRTSLIADADGAADGAAVPGLHMLPLSDAGVDQ